MPRHNDFNFELYRLTIHDDDSLLDFMGRVIRHDDEIEKVVQNACNAQWDYRQETAKSLYNWGLRDFVELPAENFPDTRSFAVKFVKSPVEKDGDILTDDSVRDGTSAAQPPPANIVTLVFQMTRHLVAAEIKSSVTNGEGWLKALHEILRKSASALEFRSAIQLQPKPKKSEIMKTFFSFQRLTRIRVHLLLPNPELTRFTVGLFNELQAGGIREYIADFRNPNGLSQSELTLPHASASMAEDGYKKKEVIMEGVRGGKKETVKTGNRPARGRVDGIRDFVRGLSTIAKTKEGQSITQAVLKEIDRISKDDSEAA